MNLEYLANGVLTRGSPETIQGGHEHGSRVAYPDTLVGTDRHTTMINGLGVVGWGVGGIEAEAVMLGQPIYMLLPEVVGFKLTGEVPEGATATDLVLTVTQMLRKHGVVGKFVEYLRPRPRCMALPTAPRIANMAPEYGATMGSSRSMPRRLRICERTGRSEATVELVENVLQGARDCSARPIRLSRVSRRTLELDLSTVEPSMAGPKRPQDRVCADEVAVEARPSSPSASRSEVRTGQRRHLRLKPEWLVDTAGRSGSKECRSRTDYTICTMARSSSPQSPVARTPATHR